MADTFDIKMDTSEIDERLNELARKSPKALEKALEKAGIQFLTWANNGSSKENRKPPIKTGFLRGSSSVFRGNKFLGVSPTGDNSEANRSDTNDRFTLKWGWNTSYAAKMHETEYKPGTHSKRDGDAGNKWLERHLKADRDLLMDMISAEFKKGAGM